MTDEQIKYENPIKALGFAMIYHAMVRDNTISDGALRTYAHILEYAQQKDRAWPGRETIAKARGKSVRVITTHFVELEAGGYITRQRRQGSSSITWIKDAERLERLVEEVEKLLNETRNKNSARAENSTSDPARAINGTTDVQNTARRTGNKLHVEEEQRKRINELDGGLSPKETKEIARLIDSFKENGGHWSVALMLENECRFHFEGNKLIATIPHYEGSTNGVNHLLQNSMKFIENQMPGIWPENTPEFEVVTR